MLLIQVVITNARRLQLRDVCCKISCKDVILDITFLCYGINLGLKIFITSKYLHSTMSVLTQKISREEWLDGVRMKSDSFKSAQTYESCIHKWDEYLKSIPQSEVEIMEELKVKNQDPETYLFLNRYVTWLSKKGLPSNTIQLCFAALKSWCASNGVMLYNEYIKRFVSFPKKRKELRVPLTIEIVRTLVEKSTLRTKAILLTLLSSGMRISEVLQLKVSDINPKTSPVEIRVRASTTKTREERLAFLSNEAWENVKILIENKTDDDFVFVKKFSVPNTLHSFELLFGKLRASCGFYEKYDNGKNYHVNVHAFRAYFHTQATKVLGGDIAHAILGHHQYLDQYFRLDKEERGQLYNRLEPYVTVSNEFRQKKLLEEKDRQIEEKDQMIDEMKLMDSRIARLEDAKD